MKDLSKINENEIGVCFVFCSRQSDFRVMFARRKMQPELWIQLLNILADLTSLWMVQLAIFLFHQRTYLLRGFEQVMYHQARWRWLAWYTFDTAHLKNFWHYNIHAEVVNVQSPFKTCVIWKFPLSCPPSWSNILDICWYNRHDAWLHTQIRMWVRGAGTWHVTTWNLGHRYGWPIWFFITYENFLA